MITPQMSGHCAFPQTEHPEESHARCDRMGGGNHARPSKEFQPCPCGCHLAPEEFECGECGGVLKAAPLWPNEWGDDETIYVHVDGGGRALGEDCTGSVKVVSRNQTVFGVDDEVDEPVFEDSDTDEGTSQEEYETEAAEESFEDLLAELEEEF